MNEAGFAGFWLHDRFEEDGIECIVTSPNKVPEKSDDVKTDRLDAGRLANNLEDEAYRRCHMPDKEVRENRQVSGTLAQKEIVRGKDRIGVFLIFMGSAIWRGVTPGGIRSQTASFAGG